MRSTTFFLALFLTFTLQAQSPFPNILLDNGGSGSYPPCEPSIAISRTDNDVIVGGAILNKNYRSFDGGQSWTTQQVSSSFGVFGDPCIVSDYKGDFYFLHLSDVAGKGWSDPKLLDRIVIQRSKDGGINWSNGAFMGEDHPKDQDKEWAAIDPRNNRIYVTWTQFDKYESQDREDESNILFSGSKRGGKKWCEPVQINDIPGDCLDDDGTTEGAVPAVGPNGEVYVAWSLNEKIYFDRSDDRGKTWGSDIEVADQPGGWTLSIPGIMRCNGMPVTLCDLSDGPHRGTIYVNWADQRNGEDDTDIFVAKSTDGGSSWSDPIRVNDDEAGSQQFLTWMTVDQTTGYLYCIFYDRRNHADLGTDVVLAYSRDGGATWTNVKISDSHFVPSQNVFFGDYNNIDSHDGRIALIWTRMDNFKTSVWASIIEDSELPSESMGMNSRGESRGASSPLLKFTVSPVRDPFEDERFPLVASKEGPALIFPFTPLRTEGVEVLKLIIPKDRNERMEAELDLVEQTLLEQQEDSDSETAYRRRIKMLHASEPYFHLGKAAYTPGTISALRDRLAQQAEISDRLVWHGHNSLRIAMYAGSPYGSSSWRLDPRVLLSKEAFDHLASTNLSAKNMLLGLHGYVKQDDLTWNESTNISSDNGGLLKIDKGYALLDSQFAAELASSLDPKSAPTPHLQGEMAYFKNMLNEVAIGNLEILSPKWDEVDSIPDLSSNIEEGHLGPQFFAVLDVKAEEWLEEFRQKDMAEGKPLLIKEMIEDLLRDEDILLTPRDSAYLIYARKRGNHPVSNPFTDNWKEPLLNQRTGLIEELQDVLERPDYYGDFWYTYYLAYRFSPLADHLWFLLPDLKVDFLLGRFLMKTNPYFRETIFFGATSEDYSGVNGTFYASDAYAVEELESELASDILLLMEQPPKLSQVRTEDWQVLSDALENVVEGKWRMFNVEFL